MTFIHKLPARLTMEGLNMLRTKELFFLGLLLFVTILNVIDLFQDYQEADHSLIHLGLEGMIVVTSVVGIGYLLQEIRQRAQEAEILRNQLNSARDDLHKLNNKLRDASRQYAAVIQEQMTAWDFTPSEKEVALLLLKGLSFEEIANIRDTKEKTVRQQATAVYRKAGLNGRHEFAAWFFEDFLG